MRGRRRGGGLSTQWSWATTRYWLGHELRPWTIEKAQAELVRRWLKAFGPATVEDVRWWTPWTLADVRPALTAIAPVEVELDGTTGIPLAGALAPTPRPDPFPPPLPPLPPPAIL